MRPELNKNLEFFKDDTIPQRPFVFACRNYECAESEQWTLACLTEEEAREVYTEMGKYFG